MYAIRSYYGDLNWIFQQEIGDNKPPWENLELYWEHSPLKYIGNAKTPTLVIHSEQDLRCELAQGEQIYVALKVLGVETELVLFPDESHGLSRTGRTRITSYNVCYTKLLRLPIILPFYFYSFKQRSNQRRM